MTLRTRGKAVRVHEIAAWLKKAAPPPVFRALRGVATAVLTPIVFSLRTGHFRSSLLSRAADAEGRAIPWYTYPAVHFLAAKDLSGRDVLEWGSGQSTLWWGARARSVVSLENDPAWFEHVRAHAGPNVSMHLVSSVAEGASIIHGRQFDVVIIDGFDRFECAARSLPVLAQGGAIILDNSDGYWGREGEYPILDLFRRRGFCRVDFYGHAAGVIEPACTSLFYNGTCFLLEGRENVRRYRGAA